MPSDDIPSWLNSYVANKDWQAYANKNYSKQENAIELFRLTITQWQKVFEKNIFTSPEEGKAWPIPKRNKCHCGIWIKRAKQEHLFEEKWIEALEGAHDVMHDIAGDLFSKYQEDHVEAARAGLPAFQAAVENMSRVLEQFE